MNQLAPDDLAEVESAIRAATDAILAQQQPDGHWVYELEADATIPAEYVLLTQYLGETANLELERKIAAYLRRIQGAHGGWPLYCDGAFDISATVKAYFALKMIGDDVEAPHMARARSEIRKRGGAIKTNVFTRILLALYGETSWAHVPTMPVELILVPRWFPIRLSKMSYWARTVIVPLLVLAAEKPLARNPRKIHIGELFVSGVPAASPRAPHQKAGWSAFFNSLDWCLKRFEPFWPKRLRARAIEKCRAWTTERLNGEDGLGAIYPAMANSVMMYDLLGYPPEHPDRATARRAVEKLLVVKDEEAYCQPCVSPVWDTSLVAHALLETKDARADQAVARGLEWLKPLQVLDVKGDWADEKPQVRSGGWAFQYRNDHYPDLDDTAVVVMAFDRAAKTGVTGNCDEAIARGAEWVEGLQSGNGGWGAFDADNSYYFLNNIPFADHGALLDPPTEDVSGRCVGMIAQLGGDQARLKAGVEYLVRTQRKDGSWWGRWGVNYIYGTWSALAGLNAAGLSADDPVLRRAADWLIAIQNSDGGWGENCDSYKLDYKGYEAAPSTASQTAWALLGLMAAGQVDHPSMARGIAYLKRSQEQDGLWSQPHYTGGGFPRVFYLNYHGYPKFFPLWALARYRNLKSCNSRRVEVGYEGRHVTVLAVTGLKREARIAGRAGVIAVTGGGDAASLKAKLDALHGDIKGVISVGLAGALSPLLNVGDVVIADQVIQERETWRCSGDWRIALAARLPHAHQGPVVASTAILATAKGKAALYDTTGALAVDMESALAGRFAAQRKLPFAVLRVISDDAGHVLPPAASVALKPDGGIALGRVLGSLARHPLQVPRLIATARASGKAFKQLLRCADLCGVGFARPDL